MPKSSNSLSFEFFSSLSGEQQAALGSKWLQDPTSASQEAAGLAASAGYELSAETIEAAVEAYLGDDTDVDVELKPELMAAVSGGGKGPRPPCTDNPFVRPTPKRK